MKVIDKTIIWMREIVNKNFNLLYLENLGIFGIKIIDMLLTFWIYFYWFFSISFIINFHYRNSN